MLREDYVRKGWRQETLQEATAVIQTRDDGSGNSGTNGGLVEWSFSRISRIHGWIGCRGREKEQSAG